MPNDFKVLVYAGPNGSGKSSAYNIKKPQGIYINADDIKKQKNCTDLEAAEEAQALREMCLANKQSFTFETVLSTDRNLEFLARAKKAGYHIDAVFVLLVSVDVNVARVKSRVSRGGHDVPEDKIRSRYEKSLANLPKLIKLSNECVVYDNTGEMMLAIFRKYVDGRTEVCPNAYWSEAAINKLIK